MVLALLTHKPAKLALPPALATRIKPLLVPRPPTGNVQPALHVSVESTSRQLAAATSTVPVKNVEADNIKT
jgi:hypothetical protein